MQARYMNKDTRKKINVENPTGRPLEFAFDRQKGDLAITSMRSDVPRTTYFQQVDSASKTLADDHKNQEIDHACPRHIKYMQQEIFANVGDEEAPPVKDDTISRGSVSSKHMYEATSFTQHGSVLIW